MGPFQQLHMRREGDSSHFVNPISSSSQSGRESITSFQTFYCLPPPIEFFQYKGHRIRSLRSVSSAKCPTAIIMTSKQAAKLLHLQPVCKHALKRKIQISTLRRGKWKKVEMTEFDQPSKEKTNRTMSVPSKETSDNAALVPAMCCEKKRSAIRRERKVEMTEFSETFEKRIKGSAVKSSKRKSVVLSASLIRMKHMRGLVLKVEHGSLPGPITIFSKRTMLMIPGELW